MQRDRATAVYCAYVWKVHCAVVRTLFQTWRHSAVVVVIKVVTVCAQCSECQREEIQESAGKRREYLWLSQGFPQVSAAAGRLASYGNQTISSTRLSCWIQILTVDVINIAADHQMFMTLTGELSWQRLRRSAVDFYSKNEKIALWATVSGT